jgi:hypothetical protein
VVVKHPFLGERSLRRALNECVEHYHAERNHQGKGDVLLFPDDTDIRSEPVIAPQRFNARTPILRAAIARSEEVAEAALLPVIPTLVLRQARSTVQDRFYRRSIFFGPCGVQLRRPGAGNT